MPGEAPPAGGPPAGSGSGAGAGTDPGSDPPAGGELTAEQEQIARWKAMARKSERLFKSLGIDPEDVNDRTVGALRDRLSRLGEIEEANKTEGQKLLERAETAERRAAEAEARVLRMEVASGKGLTAAQARRLVGATKEELEADADELLKVFGKGDPGAGGEGEGAGGERPPADLNRTPRERLRPGAVPDAEPEEMDPRKLAAKIPPMYS